MSLREWPLGNQHCFLGNEQDDDMWKEHSGRRGIVGEGGWQRRCIWRGCLEIFCRVPFSLGVGGDLGRWRDF